MTLPADVARCIGTYLPECVTCRRRTDGEEMTTIHYWCPLRRAYVTMIVPTQVALAMRGWI